MRNQWETKIVAGGVKTAKDARMAAWSDGTFNRGLAAAYCGNERGERSHEP